MLEAFQAALNDTGTDRGAVKRYFASALRQADAPGSGVVASSDSVSGAVELLAWSASDARRMHPASCVDTGRGAVKRYYVLTSRLADESRSGVAAATDAPVRSSCWRHGPPATLADCIPRQAWVQSVAL